MRHAVLDMLANEAARLCVAPAIPDLLISHYTAPKSARWLSYLRAAGDAHRDVSISMERSMAGMPASGQTAVRIERQERDAQRLASLRYHQDARPTMSLFSNIAVIFSSISITTGIFTLFAVGPGAGGLAFLWNWPILFGGPSPVTPVVAELVSRYSFAGQVLLGWPREKPAFGPGKARLVINALAGAWVVVMIINSQWRQPAPGAARYLGYAVFVRAS